MQGRAGKAPKREMVIESPQQYKSLAEIEEEEVEVGSQVAAVSALCAIFNMVKVTSFSSSSKNVYFSLSLLGKQKRIRLFYFFISQIPFQERL